MEHSLLFDVLADPTRRRILEVLRGGEQPVSDVVAAVDVHQSGVSRHLRLLDRAGFVTVRPDGQRRLYSLRPDRFAELDAWLATYRGLWETRLDRLAAVLDNERSSSTTGEDGRR